MKTHKQLLSLLCLSLALAACGGRLRNPNPTSQPAVPTANAEGVAGDSLGDALESQLQQLDQTNADAETELQSLPTP